MTQDDTFDFVYDGEYLSNYGFTVCEFDRSSDINIKPIGSAISFDRVSMNNGHRFGLAKAKYDECLTATFDICKYSCLNDQSDMVISDDEFRDLVRWLNRKSFHPFQVVGTNIIYNASFNVERIVVEGRIYGLRLTMETDKPFGYRKELAKNFTVAQSSDVLQVKDFSDEEGYIYPTVIINCTQSGNLTITNDRDPYPTVIKNCSSGERIEINGKSQIIQTSLAAHKIQNDFNYEFPKIVNSLSNRINNFSFSLPCQVEIRYSPIAKNTPDI